MPKESSSAATQGTVNSKSKGNAVSTPLVSMLIEVDKAACVQVANLLKKELIPSDREDSELSGLPPEGIGNFYFFLVAICHQTSPPGKPPVSGVVGGKQRRGWDYLSAKFETAVAHDSGLLTAKRWARMTGEELTGIFRDVEQGETLTDPDLRAELIRDLGVVMQANSWASVNDIYAQCQGRITDGEPSLLTILSGFRAYRDPVRKKSVFFLSLMRNTGLWRYPDEHRLGPPVDYHEVRGHLRLGTVKVKDRQLEEKLRRQIPVDEAEDIAIRTAVHDAIMMIFDEGGFESPSQLHYLFWNVFRSCCQRESPHCLRCPVECSLPERYVALANAHAAEHRCVFQDVCESANRESRYYEHVFLTDYY